MTRPRQLQIVDPRERVIVRAADAALGVVSSIARPFTRHVQPHDPRRILLLRLERIGDLLMALPAIRDVRSLAPAAQIDLVVGSWNADLARAIPFVNRVLTLDAKWLARDGTGLGVAPLLSEARRWRTAKYDVAINFEPDVRSNLLLAVSGAAWTAGWTSGGGGPVLDQALDFDPGSHTTANARRLIRAVLGEAPPESGGAFLAIPDAALRAASLRLRETDGRGTLVALHVSGGRPIKQWDLDRFTEVAARLVDTRGARIVLTGSRGDRLLVDHVRTALPTRAVIDAAGDIDLLELAALLTKVDLLITGDTGPMHLAAAVGTPVVAVFGPSDPARYAPAERIHRIVRVDLPCSPCNRIRQPPARCIGHTPDCLTGVSSAAVLDAALSVLDSVQPRLTRAGRS